MTVSLDPPRRAGGVTVAALCRCEVRARPATRGAVCSGRKRPVALLVLQGARILAIGLDGRPVDPDEIEALCPGALAQFRAAAG